MSGQTVRRLTANKIADLGPMAVSNPTANRDGQAEGVVYVSECVPYEQNPRK